MALTFDVSPEDAGNVLKSLSLQPVPPAADKDQPAWRERVMEMKRSLEPRVSAPFDLDQAAVYEAHFPTNGLSYTALVTPDRRRMFVLYERH